MDEIADMRREKLERRRRWARLEVEPILINSIEVLANTGHDILASSALGAQANLLMGELYCSVLPVAAEFREWSFQGDGGTTSGAFAFGFDLVSRGSCGLRF